jgi:hypothetical protein
MSYPRGAIECPSDVYGETRSLRLDGHDASLVVDGPIVEILQGLTDLLLRIFCCFVQFKLCTTSPRSNDPSPDVGHARLTASKARSKDVDSNSRAKVPHGTAAPS